MTFTHLFSFALFVPGVLSAHGLVIDHDKSVIRDELGRQRLWHGINIVNKGAPFHPFLDHYVPGLSVTSEDIEVLHTMGTSVVRLGVMMPGMYPSGPELNKTYLSTIRKIVDRLHDNGIGTILDLHQDVLAPKICGEGTPDWMLNVSALDAMPLPRPAALTEIPIDPTTGHPSSCTPSGPLKFIGWSEWYMTDQCGKAFEQLYSGVGPMAAAFESYWKELATEFKGHPGLIAYELLNEPWLGDYVHDPLLLLEGGRAEKKGVGAYMQRMHDVVKGVDPDSLILYSPAEVNNRAMRHVGYENGFLPEAAMAYHVYCIVGTDGDGPTNPILKELCHFNDGFQMTNREEDLRRLQTAGFVTEFGAVNPSPTGLAEVEFVLDHFDSMDPPTSWAFWDFGEIQRQNVSSKEIYMKVLARPYPRAVAGDLQRLSFDTNTAEFEMKYNLIDSRNVTTELFLPKTLHYPAGYSITVDPVGAVKVIDTSYGVDLVASETMHELSSTSVTIKVAPTPKSLRKVLV